MTDHILTIRQISLEYILKMYIKFAALIIVVTKQVSSIVTNLQRPFVSGLLMFRKFTKYVCLQCMSLIFLTFNSLIDNLK